MIKRRLAHSRDNRSFYSHVCRFDNAERLLCTFSLTVLYISYLSSFHMFFEPSTKFLAHVWGPVSCTYITWPSSVRERVAFGPHWVVQCSRLLWTETRSNVVKEQHRDEHDALPPRLLSCQAEELFRKMRMILLMLHAFTDDKVAMCRDSGALIYIYLRSVLWVSTKLSTARLKRPHVLFRQPPKIAEK